MRTGIIAVALGIVLPLAGTLRADEPPSGRPSLRIGAVAYAPSAVTIFEDIRRYCDKNGLAVDYVLYSNYDALVEALHEGRVDVAWNTPLAHARYHRLAGNASKTLVMRDVDCGFRSKLIARADAGITSPSGLAGRTLVLGSRDAAEATVLPLYYLKGEGLDIGKVKVLSLDEEVDLRGESLLQRGPRPQGVEGGPGPGGGHRCSALGGAEAGAARAGRRPWWSCGPRRRSAIASSRPARASTTGWPGGSPS